MRTKLPILCAVLVAAPLANAQAWSQGFDNFSNLTTAGFAFQNLSSPAGNSGWAQGNPSGSNVGNAQSGPANSWVGVGFTAAGAGANATISDWMFTPVTTLQNGDTLSFYAKSSGTFPDRMQVWLSKSGTSANVGSTATSTGDFTTKLLDINPSYGTGGPGGFPTVWTQYTINLSGITGATSGRFGVRYFVENGGPNGANADFIGVDTMIYSPGAVPEPMTLSVLAVGAAMILRRKRKS